MNPTTLRLFDAYAADHRHPMNRLTHKVAIPFIVFHVLAMLAWIPLGPAFVVGGVAVQLTGGVVGWAVATAFYAWAAPRLAPLMALLFGLCLPLAALTPRPVVVGIAVVAWTIQLIGHSVYEKNRPSFATNLVQALIGPLFFVAVTTGAWRPARA